MTLRKRKREAVTVFGVWWLQQGSSTQLGTHSLHLLGMIHEGLFLKNVIILMSLLSHIFVSCSRGRIHSNDTIMNAWMAQPSTFDEETREVLDFLHAHQNPAICDDNTKYLIHEYWNAGLGAIFHVISNHLSHALRLDRILIYHPRAQWMWADRRYCGDRKAPLSPDCYLEPFSSCQAMLKQANVRSSERCCSPRNRRGKGAQFMHIKGPR